MNPSSEREALLPCPFCGGTETTPSFSGVTKDAWAYVCCDECEACGPWVEAGEGAGDRMADAWNRRAALSTPHQAIQDLIKARDTFGWGPEVDEKINALRSLSTQPQQATAEKSSVVAWLTMNEEGEPSMLFFDQQEAKHYCGEGEQPRALGFIDLPPVPGQEGGTE